MIITCQKCSSRLQVDETKIPTRPFIIRCPKCNTSFESEAANSAVQSATAVGKSPATESSRLDQPTPAPLFQPERKDPGPAAADEPAAERLAELLSGLLQQPAKGGRGVPNPRRAWDPRKALVCVPEAHRDVIARGLSENGYLVFVAQDTRQAVDRMRENELDVVLLDARFDPVEQGVAYLTREVNILRPTQRRRLFFVLLSPSLRTMDAHTAFLNNVNATVNVNDIDELPGLLERRLKEYNDLYKEFNSALGVSAL